MKNFCLFIIFVICIVVHANDNVTAVIERAQSLTLKKNRQEAAKLLNETIKNLPPSSKNKPRLVDTLKKVSEIFITDKGQKFFESGEANLLAQPDFAIRQFGEALQLEDDNLLILNGLARAHLSKQDCRAAQGYVQRARQLHPLASEPAIFELKTLLCVQDFTSFQKLGKDLPPLNKWEESFVQYLSAQDLIHQKANRKAFDTLLKVTEENPQFPEPYFVLSQLAKTLERDGDTWLQRYASLCKNVTSRDRKRYSLEPRLCANLKEAQDELAKKNSDR